MTDKTLPFSSYKKSKNVKTYIFFAIYYIRRIRGQKWCIIQGKSYGGEKVMKKMQNNKHKFSYATVNALVMCLCVYAANTRCGWLLHQPKMPDEMKKFGKM